MPSNATAQREQWASNLEASRKGIVRANTVRPGQKILDYGIAKTVSAVETSASGWVTFSFAEFPRGPMSIHGEGVVRVVGGSL